MEVFKIAIGVLCVCFFVSFKWLEGLHHMSAIKEHYPRLYRFMTKAEVQTLLLLIAIILFVDIVIDRPSEIPKPERTEVAAPTPVPVPSGPAITTAPQSPAVSGSGNTIEYGKEPEKKFPSTSSSKSVSTEAPRK